ncbi:MAG: protein phosphatase 2C domain-containing protein [Pseudomonadota bacterium]
MGRMNLDVSTGLSAGQREYQEDALVTDFAQGVETGFAVLADGMGGHAAGDVASKIVVTEVFSQLKFRTSDAPSFQAHAADILKDAANDANERLTQHVEEFPETRGMGATLVAPVIQENKLWWISIGDSPLFLFRDGELSQLNEDHSMAPQIDMMAKTGMMDPEVARDHPDRNCLTSVIFGEKIAQIDCPEEPVTLRPGDIVILASDGLQFLSDDEIGALLSVRKAGTSGQILELLMSALEKLQDPDQDNISICVIKVNAAEEQKKDPPPPPSKPRLANFAPTRLISAPKKFFLRPAAYVSGGK